MNIAGNTKGGKYEPSKGEIRIIKNIYVQLSISTFALRTKDR